MQSTVKSWLTRLFATPPPVADGELRPALTGTQPHAVPSQPRTPPRSGEQMAHDMSLLAWMADGPAFTVGPAGPREHAALLQLDQLVADTTAHHRLLPRAAAVIPPLLARLRSPALSLTDLAQHVSRDMTLVSEVIRMANSAHYRRDAAVVELDHALRVLGVEGLRSAIARAVLKPLIDVRNGRLVACSAARLWEHTDKKAQLCSALAPSLGIEAFEGCLAALAHNAVWSSVLRTMDEIGGEQAWRLGPAFVDALGSRRNRLFAIVARQWQLAEGVIQAAAEMAEHDPAADALPAARLLCSGDRLAWLLCMPDRSRATAQAALLLRDADPSVRACYLALEAQGEIAPAS